MGNGMEGIKFDIKKAAEAVQKELNNESTQNLFKKQEESVFQEENEINSSDFKTRLTEDFGFKEETADAIWEFLNIDTDEDSEDKLDTEELDFWMQQIGRDYDDEEGNDTVTLQDITEAAKIGYETPDYTELQEAVDEYLNPAQAQTDEVEVVTEGETTDALRQQEAGETQTDEVEVVTEGETAGVLRQQEASEAQTDEVAVVAEDETTDALRQQEAGKAQTDETEVVPEVDTTYALRQQEAGKAQTDEVEVVAEGETADALRQQEAGETQTQTGNTLKDAGVNGSQVADKVSVSEDGTYTFELTKWDNNPASLNCESRIMQNIYGVSYSAKENKDCYETLLKLNGYSGTVTPDKGTIQVYSLQDLREATAELAAGTSIEEVRNNYSPLQESKKGEYYEENADGNYVFDLTVVSEMDVNNMLHERDMTEGKSSTEAALGEIETISEEDAAELLRINGILGPIAANTTVVDEITLIDTLRVNDVSDDNIELYLTTAFKMDEATAAEIMRRNDLNSGNSYDKVCEKAKEISEVIGDGTGKNGLQTIDNMPEFPDCDKVSTKAVLQAAYYMFGDNRLGEMLNGSYTKTALNSLKQTPAENQSYAIGDIVFAGSDGTLPGIVVGINGDGTLQVVQGGLSKDKINNGILENTVSPNKISGFIALGAQEEIKANEAQEQAEKRLADTEEQKTIKNLEEKIQILGYDSKIQEYDLNNITGITTVRLETGEIFEISGEENAENISGYIDEQTSIEIVSDGKINSANKKAYEYIQQLLDKGYEISCETNDKEVKITTTLNGQEVTYTYTPTENNDGFIFISEQNGKKVISAFDLDGKFKEQTIILKNDENGEETITSYENLSFEKFKSLDNTGAAELIQQQLGSEELSDAKFNYDGEKISVESEDYTYVFEKDNTMYQYDSEGKPIFVKSQDTQGTQYNLYGIAFELDESGGIPMDKFIEIERKAASMGHEIESISSIAEKGEIHIEYFGE